MIQLANFTSTGAVYVGRDLICYQHPSSSTFCFVLFCFCFFFGGVGGLFTAQGMRYIVKSSVSSCSFLRIVNIHKILTFE